MIDAGTAPRGHRSVAGLHGPDIGDRLGPRTVLRPDGPVPGLVAGGDLPRRIRAHADLAALDLPEEMLLDSDRPHVGVRLHAAPPIARTSASAAPRTAHQPAQYQRTGSREPGTATRTMPGCGATTESACAVPQPSTLHCSVLGVDASLGAPTMPWFHACCPAEARRAASFARPSSRRAVRHGSQAGVLRRRCERQPRIVPCSGGVVRATIVVASFVLSW
ncbi:hypothetical protein STTU_4943 [Streptomyces sp. Tu6071]|nr:hypothetical protein STTU_4943 [Streptomyces sp. Tu6071]